MVQYSLRQLSKKQNKTKKMGVPDAVARDKCSSSCETDDMTFLTHRLDFCPTAAHDAGTFSCDVICVYRPDPVKSQTCDHVSVVAGNTTTSTTTGADNGKSDSHNAGVIRIAVGVTVGVVVSYLVSWCFQPSQPQGISSGLNTNFTLSPSYSFHKSSYHKSCFLAYLYSVALNTGTCIRQGDLFHSAGLHRKWH